MPGRSAPADSATAPPITTCSGLIRLAIEAMTRAMRSEIRSRMARAAGSPAAASAKTRGALAGPPAEGPPPAARPLPHQGGDAVAGANALHHVQIAHLAGGPAAAVEQAAGFHHARRPGVRRPGAPPDHPRPRRTRASAHRARPGWRRSPGARSSRAAPSARSGARRRTGSKTAASPERCRRGPPARRSRRRRPGPCPGPLPRLPAPARQARSTTPIRSCAGMSAARKLPLERPITVPRRSATAAVVVAAPMSRPSTKPASRLKAKRRAGRPFRGLAGLRAGPAPRSSPGRSGPRRRQSPRPGSARSGPSARFRWQHRRRGCGAARPGR